MPQQAEARECLDVGQTEVFQARLGEDQSLALAVFGQQADPGRDGIARLIDRQPLAVEFQLAVFDSIRPKDQPGRLGPARADQSRQP